MRELIVTVPFAGVVSLAVRVEDDFDAADESALFDRALDAVYADAKFEGFKGGSNVQCESWDFLTKFGEGNVTYVSEYAFEVIEDTPADDQ